jgi:predicted RNA binding protein YcfA (HicA-like mRNA interferase family)
MSTKYPKLTGKQLIKILYTFGFEVTRIRGSHHILKHTDGRRTVIPMHGSETIGPGLLNKILKDVDMKHSQL